MMIKYIAEDYREFDDENLCLAYENELLRRAKWDTFLQETIDKAFKNKTEHSSIFKLRVAERLAKVIAYDCPAPEERIIREED